MAHKTFRVLSPTAVLGYGFPEASNVVHFDPASAVKCTMIRPLVLGALGDTDIYGAQQHAPLLKLRVPVKSS